jgi:CHAT domain-containing protein
MSGRGRSGSARLGAVGWHICVALLMGQLCASKRRHCELVVLSACDSQGLGAAGDNLRGSEGVLGLPWGFLSAGTPSVIASLRRVNDTSTAGLMGNLYAQIEKAEDKLTAFTEARKRHRRTHPDPFDWAPFIYVGDPR